MTVIALKRERKRDIEREEEEKKEKKRGIEKKEIYPTQGPQIGLESTQVIGKLY